MRGLWIVVFHMMVMHPNKVERADIAVTAQQVKIYFVKTLLVLKQKTL
jgi:hypothetical protein